jgi:iron complex transport system substrate-binding protein
MKQIQCLTLCRSIPTRYREQMRVNTDNGAVSMSRRMFRRQSIRLLAGFGVVLMALTSCASPEKSAELQQPASASLETDSVSTPIMIKSSDVAFPTPVTAPWQSQAPSRIVTLATGSGEIVAALGGADRVVGRDETSQSPEIDRAPIVTSGHAVNAEAVIAAQPDLVIVDPGTGPSEALDQIRSVGIEVVEVPEAFSVAEVSAKVLAIGAAIGAPKTAIDQVIELSTGGPNGGSPQGNTELRVVFLYLRGTSAIYLLGGNGSGADDLITRSGATDVGAEAGFEAFTPLTAEELINLNPDAVLVMMKGLESVGGVDGLFQLPGLAQSNAATTRYVVAVDDTLLLTFGPRTSGVIDSLTQAWSEFQVNGVRAGSQS